MRVRSAVEVISGVLKSEKLERAVAIMVVSLRNGLDPSDASIGVLGVIAHETSRLSQEIISQNVEEPPVDEL